MPGSAQGLASCLKPSLHTAMGHLPAFSSSYLLSNPSHSSVSVLSTCLQPHSCPLYPCHLELSPEPLLPRIINDGVRTASTSTVLRAPVVSFCFFQTSGRSCLLGFAQHIPDACVPCPPVSPCQAALSCPFSPLASAPPLLPFVWTGGLGGGEGVSNQCSEDLMNAGLGRGWHGATPVTEWLSNTAAGGCLEPWPVLSRAG